LGLRIRRGSSLVTFLDPLDRFTNPGVELEKVIWIV
jgi:hypothetical protein